MREIEELDAQLRNYMELSPEQQEQARRRVIERAEALRAELIRDLFRRFFAWLKRRRAMAELQALDDRMLRDMGINRSEIESAVHGRHRSQSSPAPRWDRSPKHDDVTTPLRKAS